MNFKTKDTAAYILTGGQSRRLKKQKCFIEIKGKSLIDYIFDTLQPLFSDVFTVGKVAKLDKFNFIEDKSEVQCPLNGIITAVEHSQNNWCFISACDMPLLQQNTIIEMSKLISSQVNAVVPVLDGRKQPLCAFYSKNILNEFVRALDNQQYKLMDIIEGLTIAEYNVPPNDSFQFINVNYPEDLVVVESIMKDN